MRVFHDAAATARIRRRRNRTNPEIVETDTLQQKNAKELAELDRKTKQLKAEYDDLYDRYVRVCEYHKLPIVQLEDMCPECICIISQEVMMLPVSIRKQQKAYEQYTITKWFNEGNTSDPNRIEKDQLTVANLTPNNIIKRQIDEYKEFMRKTIKDNPLSFDDDRLAAGLRRKKTKRKRRRKRRKHKKSIKEENSIK